MPKRGRDFDNGKSNQKNDPNSLVSEVEALGLEPSTQDIKEHDPFSDSERDRYFRDRKSRRRNESDGLEEFAKLIKEEKSTVSESCENQSLPNRSR